MERLNSEMKMITCSEAYRITKRLSGKYSEVCTEWCRNAVSCSSEQNQPLVEIIPLKLLPNQNYYIVGGGTGSEIIPDTCPRKAFLSPWDRINQSTSVFICAEHAAMERIRQSTLAVDYHQHIKCFSVCVFASESERQNCNSLSFC